MAISRKLVFIAALPLAAIILCVAWKKIKQRSSDDFFENTQEPLLAVYDNSKATIALPGFESKSYTLKWINNNPGSLPAKAMQNLINTNKPFFLNLEIWPEELLKHSGKTIAGEINNGVYDEKIKALAALLATSAQPIYIRYNPEMEVPSYQKPWQNESPFKYIQSFKRLSIFLKLPKSNVKMVWAPSGYPGTEELWPGNEYTDYCSTTLKGVVEFKDDRYPAYPSLLEMARRKLYRYRYCSKPVFLLGSEAVGSNNINSQFINELSGIIKKESNYFFTPVEPLNTDTAVIKPARESNLVIGVYDPELKLTSTAQVTVEHLFTDLISIENGVFKKGFDAIIARRHNVIVTCEPWKDGKNVKDTNVLVNTVNGLYDKAISKLFSVISAVPNTVYFRWAHEMEIPIERYPWQSKDPVAYIKAFRHVAGKPHGKNVKIVWGPAGDRGSIEWYPGDDVVDYVSIAIYGLPDKNISDHTKQLSFTSIFKNKYHRMRFAHKPIFITEFGVKGPQEYKKQWLADAAYTINKYTEVKGINYFSFKDVPKAWGDGEVPDWTVTPETFNYFISLLKDVKH